MVILYDAGGARDFELHGPACDDQELEHLLYNVSQLLVVRGETQAAGLLASMRFNLSNATNHLNDEFLVLHTSVGLTQYEYLREASGDKELKRTFSVIASTAAEIGLYIRFIVGQLDQSRPPDNWRADLNNFVAALSSNQALFTFKNSQKIIHEGLNFRSKTEVKIFDTLVKRGLLVLPLPVAVMGRNREYKEPDFVVCYQGKVGILEIHGDKWHPPETAAKESERRRVFAKLGVSVYEIFSAERCWNDPNGVVDDFMQALVR